MKKLILATAIAAISATSAHATTVYEGEGVKLTVEGNFELYLRQEQGNDENLDVEFEDMELLNRIEYDLGNGMTAFGQLDFNFADAANDDNDGADLEEAYIGFGFGSVNVRFGKMDLASDEFGIEMAYKQVSAEDQFDAQGADGDDVIRVDAEFGEHLVSASYELESEGNSSENGQSIDLFVGLYLGGVELAGAYQQKEPTPGADKEDTWGLSAAYDAGVVEVAADYSVTDLNAGREVTLTNLAAAFPVGDTTTVAVGLIRTEDDAAADDVNEWYANVTYQFASQENVSVFAEIADTDEDDVDMGFLIGANVVF